MRSSPWTGGLPPWQLWTARLIWPWATSTRWDTCPRACPVKAFSPEKDASDMELALEEALAARRRCRGGVRRARGAGSTTRWRTCSSWPPLPSGGSLWPQWGSASVSRFSSGPGELRLPALPSGIVSVFSLTDVSAGVVEEGLKYGLDGVALTNRTSWGLSNEMVDEPARIAVESGTLAVFMPL